MWVVTQTHDVKDARRTTRVFTDRDTMIAWLDQAWESKIETRSLTVYRAPVIPSVKHRR